MVRHFTFITTVLVVMGLLTHIDAKAQGQDANHKWNGNPISSIADQTDEDMNTVYLYNVGTGKFLNTGSYWGTVAIGFNVGMTIHVKKHNGFYKMEGPLGTSAGNLIAFGRRKDTPGFTNPINYNHVYVDRGIDFDNTKIQNPYCTENHHINGVIDWTFTETSYGSRTYNISFVNDEKRQGYPGKRYLQMERNKHNPLAELI